MNTQKGHQGFIKLYSALGETRHIRVPISISEQIKEIILLLEALAKNKGIDKTKLVLDKITEGLDNAISSD